MPSPYGSQIESSTPEQEPSQRNRLRAVAGRLPGTSLRPPTHYASSDFVPESADSGFPADSRVEMASAGIKLDPQAVEAVARKVVELLEKRGLQRRELVDAAELARRLGIERSWVYSHAIELGAVKLGSGPKPRLRFDPEIAARVLREVGEGPAADPPARSGERAGQPQGRRGTEVPLLPVRGPGNTGPPPAA